MPSAPSAAPTPQVFGPTETASVLPFPALLTELRRVLKEYAAGAVRCPSRLSAPLAQGSVMLSMPAVAAELAVHKLVTVCPANRAAGLPTIQGTVTAYDARSGTPLFALDAPAVTARRTAALSLLGITVLHGTPGHVAIIGTGGQARGHLEALQVVFPEANISVVGRTLAQARTFCASGQATARAAVPDEADVVITTTTSKTPVYTLPARAGRLLIGTGAFTADAAEISAEAVNASQLYVDDPAGAQHEAGDLLLAGADWSQVRGLADALDRPPRHQQPVLLKTVGCAAWDLAACRVAQQHLLMAASS